MYKDKIEPLQRFKGPPEQEIRLVRKVDLTRPEVHIGWFREKRVMKGYIAWIFEDGEVYVTKPGLLSQVDILFHLSRSQLKELILE